MKHVFVETIPDELEPDTLYVSLTYNVAIHKCASGCGLDVVTPLSPAEWSLTYNGQTVSLRPSIGNWGFPCRSHYFITNGKVRWAGAMSSEEIAAVRERDLADKEVEYGGALVASKSEPERASALSLWGKLFRLFR